MNDSPTASGLSEIRNAILDYLVGCQDFTPGEFYGSFWSEKAYHGPLLDYHAGGSHHHRAAGSAALAFWRIGRARNDPGLLRRAEAAFLLSKRTDSGLLPMRDRGEEIADCAFMQADMLLFLLPSQE